MSNRWSEPIHRPPEPRTKGVSSLLLWATLLASSLLFLIVAIMTHDAATDVPVTPSTPSPSPTTQLTFEYQVQVNQAAEAGNCGWLSTELEKADLVGDSAWFKYVLSKRQEAGCS